LLQLTAQVWVNFWGVPTTAADWRIKAGLSITSTQLFRSMACKEVDSSDYLIAPIRSGNGNTYLYQAYLGRVSGVRSFNVIVDDSAYTVGTATLRGDINRTWYDGVSYASVNGVTNVAENKELPAKFDLNQNYPNPFNPTTQIKYSVPQYSYVSLKVFNLLGKEVATLFAGVHQAGNYVATFNGNGLASGVYFYQLKVSNAFNEIKKMVLMK
jgi:hypothetical protein